MQPTALALMGKHRGNKGMQVKIIMEAKFKKNIPRLNAHTEDEILGIVL
jgi:hypothetical protein